MPKIRAVNSRIRSLVIMIAVAFALSLAACAIIPLRLMRESRYTFGFVGDEYLYAQRVQPLIDGTTAINSLNNAGDPSVISPFYLEDFTRAVVRISRLDVVTFIWSWRWLFPIALAASFFALSSVCLDRRRRTWSAPLRWAVAGAAFPLLYCMYSLTMEFPPLHGFINRFPTNIEYPLSILLAAQYVSFLKNPTDRAGVFLALISATTAYLRMYLAFPWSIAIIGGFGYLILARQVSARVVIVTVGLVALLMCPWLYISRMNAGSQEFSELILRYFGKPGNYTVHSRWPLYLGISVLLLAGARAVQARHRVLAFGVAGTMLLLPFICGLLPFASEVLMYDRWSSFYLTVILAVAMLALESRSLDWRGRRGETLARRAVAVCVIFGALGAGILGAMNLTYDFAQYPQGPYRFIKQDLQYVPAYQWVGDNTPPGALFLVDDGFDWSINPKYNSAGLPVVSGFAPDGTFMLAVDDLFQIVAKRPRVYTHRLMGFVLKTADVMQLAYLHRGTFGLPVPSDKYIRALQRFRPGYILWKKAASAPVPRGFGSTLRARSEIVYTDSTCEIWKINY